MSFRYRSYQKELLDEDHIPFMALKKNMQELDTINSLLGGHSITIDGFTKLLGQRNSITICEIGCGGGDNLAAIVHWCNKNRVEVRCIGIDMKPECITLARERHILQGITEWIVNDYAAVIFATPPDIIFSSLFCHHFTDEQLVTQLQWMEQNCSTGFFINDLHRHWLAYYSIRVLTTLFSSSYLVKNDAPLSVARGFRKIEWELLARQAGLQTQVQWKWAFRHLLTYRHE